MELEFFCITKKKKNIKLVNEYSVSINNKQLTLTDSSSNSLYVVLALVFIVHVIADVSGESL